MSGARMSERVRPSNDIPLETGVHCMSMHSWRDIHSNDVLLEFYDDSGEAIGHITLTKDMADRLAERLVSKTAKN